MKEHSSQGRGIFAALLLAAFAGITLNAADAKFIVVAKGQRWMQTNSSAATLVPDSNHVFMVSVDTSGPDTVTNGFLVLPGASVIQLDGDGGDHGGIEEMFVSQSTMDVAFPNGTYQVVIEGVNDGLRTNSISVSGDSYPSTPYFDDFSATQTIDPSADFTLTWEPISGATTNDFVSIEVVDCSDEQIVSTPPPGAPGAMDGTATNFLFRARSLRPGMIYKVKMFVAHFTTYDETSYPGATVAGGYLKEIYLPIATTGTPVDCPPGRLQMVFNFPEGGFDQTNGFVSFPQVLANYVVQLEVRYEANPPEGVTFTGPSGSGLSDTTNAFASVGEWGAWFVSPAITVPPYPPGGLYVVNYGGNNWSYNLLDPNAADEQMLIIPTVVLNESSEVQEVYWRYADTNGVTIDAPPYVDDVAFSLDGMSGTLYRSDDLGEPLSSTTTNHVLAFPVPWEDVASVTMLYRDIAKNTFVTSYRRDSNPPPGLEIVTQELPVGVVGQTYGASLSATGGQSPYFWSLFGGSLPEGLTLSPDTGNIIGHPATNGSFEIAIRVTDSTDAYVEKEFTLTVEPNGDGDPNGPEVLEIALFKGQEFLQTGTGAAVLGSNDPFHFEAFVEGGFSDSITNVVLRSPKGTNYPMEIEEFALSASPIGEGEGGGGGGGETFRIQNRFPTKSAMDSVFNSGSYQFQISTGSGSNHTAALNLSGDNYPATPHVSNWAAAQEVDAFADFTLTWDALTGATTNDFVSVQIEDELGTIFETDGPRKSDPLNGKSTSALIPGGTLEPGHEYKCSVLLAKFVTLNTTVYPGATAFSAYVKATFITLNTLTPPPVEGQFQFSASSFTVSETNATAQFTITRTGGSEGSVSVDFSTADGSAVADLDYVPTEGTLDFAEGETNVTFTFEILDDEIFETNETVRLVLSNPTGGASLGSQSNAVMIITDNDTPGTAGLLQFSAATYVVGEASATVTLTVTRTGGKAGEVTVDYLTVDGSALGEEDFTPDFGTLTFPDGVTTRTIVVGLNNDDLDETNETFEVMLDAPFGGASLGTRNVASVVITDNDSAGEIKFSAAAIKVDETVGEAVVTLTRSGGTAEGVTVDISVAGGTATPDEDFSLSSETVEFAAGETTATFSLIINDDSDSEGDETVLLELSNPTGGATLGKGTNATVLIVDDEVSFQLGAESYSVNEGSPSIVVAITRSGPTTGTVSVDLSTVDGTAEGDSDFVATNTTVIFGPGVKSRSVAIRIIGDDLVEDEETFGVVLENPDGGQLGNVTEAVVTLTDNDVGGELNFKISNFTAKEKGPVAVVIVSRTGGSAGGVTFDFTTEDDTAADGDDYTGVTETFEFPAGAKDLKIEIPIIDDGLDEENETVLLAISNPTGGAILGERDSATLTILDDDTGGVVAFGSTKYSISETGTTATITLTRSSGKAEGATVDVITSGGTASPDVDYTAVTNTVTFAANETKLTFDIDIIDDDDAEGDETVIMELANPGGGARLGSKINAVLTILDDELSVQFSEATYEVIEGVRYVNIVVTRGGPKGAFTVQYTTEDDSATAGSDYTSRSGSLSFSASAKTKKISIPILNDTVTEDDETFTVTLSDPTGGAILGPNATTTITIHDNDPASAIARSARASRR